MKKINQLKEEFKLSKLERKYGICPHAKKGCKDAKKNEIFYNICSEEKSSHLKCESYRDYNFKRFN